MRIKRRLHVLNFFRGKRKRTRNRDYSCQRNLRMCMDVILLKGLMRSKHVELLSVRFIGRPS